MGKASERIPVVQSLEMGVGEASDVTTLIKGPHKTGSEMDVVQGDSLTKNANLVWEGKDQRRDTSVLSASKEVGPKMVGPSLEVGTNEELVGPLEKKIPKPMLVEEHVDPIQTCKAQVELNNLTPPLVKHKGRGKKQNSHPQTFKRISRNTEKRKGILCEGANNQEEDMTDHKRKIAIRDDGKEDSLMQFVGLLKKQKKTASLKVPEVELVEETSLKWSPSQT